MFNLFGGKKTAPEKSPGGSVIHRYDAAKWSVGRTEALEESAAAFAAARHTAYEKLFGAVDRVFEEHSALVPRIDLRAYYRVGKDGGRVCALATSGMSDVEMRVPARSGAPSRVELILYCTEPLAEYVETLRWLAHFPHDQKTWVGMGHTIPNGNPPAPFWGSTALDTVLLMPTIVNRDATLPEELVLNGAPVHFLWVVPLTQAECRLKLAKGFPAILDLFEEHRHPHVLDPRRQSYV